MNPLPVLDLTRCVVYRRVSSAEQERASGPERQRQACERFAAANALEIVADRFEDLSGTLPLSERPQLSGALSACLEHGAGILLVEERTRLARDEYAAHDALRTFARAGVRVLYADGSNGNRSNDPATMLLDGIGHAVAAYDRRVIVARMAAGRRAKAEREPKSRAQGGKLPYGYRRTRTGGIEIEPDAAAEVRHAFELVRAGKSVRTAAAQMGWHPTMLARIVKDPSTSSPANGESSTRASGTPPRKRSSDAGSRRAPRPSDLSSHSSHSSEGSVFTRASPDRSTTYPHTIKTY